MSLPSSSGRRHSVTWPVFAAKTKICSYRRAIILLAGQPYPDSAIAWGATGICRLHSAGIRVLYEVDNEAATLYIINIGIMS
jgi:hypothetical protein